MAKGENVEPQNLNNQGPPIPPLASLREAREAVERDMIQKALLKHEGNISHAAAELDVSRPTLYELMQKLGIRRQ